MSSLAPAVPWRQDASTIGVVSVAHGMSHFCQLMVPPLFPWIGASFGLSNTRLGALMSVFFIVSCAGQAAAGFVVDRFGAPRVLMAGLALMAVAAFGLALAPDYPTLLLCMAIAGLGNCVFHPVDFSILNGRISAPRLGHAYAAHGISGSLGWALAPVFVVGVAGATGSWRQALVAVGALVLATLALVVLRRDTLAQPRSRSAASAPPDPGFGFLRHPAVWACFLFFTVYAMALGGLQSFAPAAAAQIHGLPMAQAAVCLSVYMVAAGVGMVLGGHLVRDPQRAVRVASFGFAVAATAAVLLALGHWPGLLVLALFALMGTGSGIAGPSRDLLVKQATPPGATGRVYGVVYSGLDVGMTVAPLAFGAMMDAGRFREVWLGIALMLALLIGTAFNVRRSSRAAAAPA
ncbi:MAG: MFS transporter [Rubrivivax sp.]|nr:MFS transporter [Rubrivivax sp.]